MSIRKLHPVGLPNVTGPHWKRGNINQGRNKIFGIDPIDGSDKLVCEVFGYSSEEVDANIEFILNSVNDKFFRQTP